jgi:uncharacterized protein YwgA
VNKYEIKYTCEKGARMEIQDRARFKALQESRARVYALINAEIVQLIRARLHNESKDTRETIVQSVAKVCSESTAQFQSINQEIRSLQRESEDLELVNVIDRIQMLEKSRLELVKFI